MSNAAPRKKGGKANRNKRLTELTERFVEQNRTFLVDSELHTNKNPDIYFKDVTRKIDYILVFNYPGNGVDRIVLNHYIKVLQQKGLQFESQFSKKNSKVLFIKVHCPKIILLRYALAFDIELACNIVRVEGHIPKDSLSWWCRSKLDDNKEIPGTITYAERIMITYALFKDIPFGDGKHQYGLESLYEDQYLLDAYPLHDGFSEVNSNSTNINFENTRQLLIKYWAHLRNCLRSQPIDTINEYYGAEFAFFFVFYDYYTWMLLPLAIVGIISFIFGIKTYKLNTNYISQSICNSDKTLCPYCNKDVVCGFKPIKNECLSSKWTYILDNNGSFLYALLLCIWATLFLELWKRKQAILTSKWNLLNVEEDPSSRPEFVKRAKYWRESKYRGKMLPYVPTKIRLAKLILSFTIVIWMNFFVILVAIGLVIVKILFAYQLVSVFPEITDIISMVMGNLLMLLLMVLFEMVYPHISKALTDFENPSTQTEYDKSFIYKLISLNFINAYTHLYYTSFFKGSFFTHPGDLQQYDGIGIINEDRCASQGCINDICIQLLFTIVGKAILKRVIEVIKIFMTTLCRKRKLKHIYMKNKLPLWEESYYEIPAARYYLINDQLELVLQYGYMILFTAAVPLAPLFAFLYNLIFIRIDAYKYLKFYRRPVPCRTGSIGTWNHIIHTLTFIGIATNAFLVSFTSHFIARLVLNQNDIDKTQEYFQYTFSVFNVNDYNNSLTSKMMLEINGEFCYYVGQRHPPDHELKYEHTGNYWKYLSIKLLFVLAFEFIVICVTAALAFAIPDIPSSVKERIAYDKKAKDEKREEDMINELINNMRNTI